MKESVEEKFWRVARETAGGGHATIFTFSSNCVAFFGTPSGDVRDFLDDCEHRFSNLNDAMKYASENPEEMNAWTRGLRKYETTADRPRA
jgi:hypothetical protein